MARIAVAMSGGLDSTLAALLLKDQGHSIVGLTMRLPHEGAEQACEDAARAARQHGFAHHVVDMAQDFGRDVVGDFTAEYAAGRTPNPCVRCNQRVKFGTLLQHALALDCDAFATGHYAATAVDEQTGRQRLLRARDPDKDQTYFLFALGQAQLARVRFPLSALTKDEARRELARRGMARTAEREESQDICFAPSGGHRRLLRERVPDAFRPGDIVDLDGRAVGRHRGVANYTIGQRRGLGLPAPRPLYVVAIEAATNRVVVGPDEALWRRELKAVGCNWIGPAQPPRQRRCFVKVRYRSVPAAGTITAQEDGLCEVCFDAPQRAITPGQAAVFYSEDQNECLGGGWIS